MSETAAPISMEDTFRAYLEKFANDAINVYLDLDNEYTASSEKIQEAAITYMMGEYMSESGLFAHTGVEQAVALHQAITSLSVATGYPGSGRHIVFHSESASLYFLDDLIACVQGAPVDSLIALAERVENDRMIAEQSEPADTWEPPIGPQVA